MNAILQRLETGDEGTFGTLTLDGAVFSTGELPWRDNAVGISCIPPGTYECLWQFSPVHKRNLYHLQNVPGRTAVEMHTANFSGDTTKINPNTGKNYVSDLKGCIALGVDVGEIYGQKAVIHSAGALSDFEEMLNQQPFTIIIISC